MTWLTVTLLVLVLAAAIIVMAVKRHPLRTAPDDESWPLFAKKPLSPPEQVLYHRLVKALPECVVLAQVQLSRLLGVKKGAKFTSWHNRISQKSVDFVVCLKDSSVVAVVELDDSSHERASRQEADATKNKALASAGLTVIRWNVKALPEESEIRATFTA